MHACSLARIFARRAGSALARLVPIGEAPTVIRQPRRDTCHHSTVFRQIGMSTLLM